MVMATVTHRHDDRIPAVMAVAPRTLAIVVECDMPVMAMMELTSLVIIDDGGAMVVTVMRRDHHVSLGGHADSRDAKRKRQGAQDQSLHVYSPVC
ncbi:MULTISPECIES: hypothetical protein [unclassified Mesorhizobium]